MYDADFWSKIITGLFNLFSSLAWPVIVLVIVLIFKSEISELITKLTKVKILGCEFEIGDKVRAFSPKDNKYIPASLQPLVEPTEEKEKTKAPKLSDEEIKQSKQRALKRLEEDTKRVGYQRGELFQLEDSGQWAIAWKIEVNDKIDIKG